MGSKPGSALEQGDIIMLTVAGGDTVNVTVKNPAAHFGSYLDDRVWAEFEAVREDNGMSGRIRYRAGDVFEVIGKCAHVRQDIGKCGDCGTILNERSSPVRFDIDAHNARAELAQVRERLAEAETGLERNRVTIRDQGKRITELSAEASTARIARRSAENDLRVVQQARDLWRRHHDELRERGEKQLAELRLQRDEARNARNTRDQELQNALRQRDAAREALDQALLAKDEARRALGLTEDFRAEAARLRTENTRLDGMLRNRNDRIRALEQAIRTVQGVL